jgi:hypothetical protein
MITKWNLKNVGVLLIANLNPSFKSLGSQERLNGKVSTLDRNCVSKMLSRRRAGPIETLDRIERSAGAPAIDAQTERHVNQGVRATLLCMHKSLANQENIGTCRVSDTLPHARHFSRRRVVSRVGGFS